MLCWCGSDEHEGAISPPRFLNWIQISAELYHPEFFHFFLSNLDSSANVQAFCTEVVETHPTRVTFIISTCVTRGRAGNPRPRFTHTRDDKFQRGICALLVCEKLRWQLVYFIRFWKKKKKNSREFPTNWSLCQQMHNFALSKCLKMTQVFHSNPPCVMVTVTFWMEIAQMWSFCSTSFHHGNIFGLSCLPFKTSSSSFQHIPTHWIHRISQQRE